MSPSVSIVIPCFNAARYLAATLDSALAQTHAPHEVIVVDDHSTDDSRTIAKSYAPGVVVIENNGKGASSARNTGTSIASGEFIQYLDADDLLEPDAIGKKAAALAAEEADVAIGDWQRLIQRDGVWRNGKTESGALPDPAEPVDIQVLQGFWAPPAAILYRRSLCEKIGGWRETLPIIQDARFLLDAGRVGGRFVHVPGVCAHYRQHGGSSLSGAPPALFWRDVLTNTREVEALWKDANQLDSRRNSTLADAYAHCVRVGFQRDRYLFEDALAQYRRFPTHKPSRFLRVALPLHGLLGYKLSHKLLASFARP